MHILIRKSAIEIIGFSLLRGQCLTFHCVLSHSSFVAVGSIVGSLD